MTVEEVSFKKEIRSLLREINFVLGNEKENEKKLANIKEEWDENNNVTGENGIKSFVTEPHYNNTVSRARGGDYLTGEMISNKTHYSNMGNSKFGNGNFGIMGGKQYEIKGEV